MKIAYVITSLVTGGAERLVVDLAREAVAQGNKVTIVTLVGTEGVPKALAKQNGLEVHILGTSRFDPRNFLRLRRLVSASDIVHANLFPAFYLAAWTGKPCLMTEHSTTNRRMSGGALWSLIEKVIYGRYGCVAVISDGVMEVLTEYFRRIGVSTPVEVVHNGIRQEFYRCLDKQAPKGNAFRLITVGSLRPIKNFELAIRAIAHLSDVTLDIAGVGPMREDLHRVIDSLGLEARVRLIGSVQDVASLLPRYDAFLSTSHHEGFGLAAVEAMACGLPVVGPNIPGFSGVVRDGKSGLLYESADPQVVAGLIAKLRDEELYLQLSAGARHGAAGFTLTRCFESYMRIYKRLLNQNLW